jgi:hypothetical protein
VVDRHPHARRLEMRLGCSNLTCLVVGDGYPNDQLGAVRNSLTGRRRENSTTTADPSSIVRGLSSRR